MPGCYGNLAAGTRPVLSFSSSINLQLNGGTLCENQGELILMNLCRSVLGVKCRREVDICRNVVQCLRSGDCETWSTTLERNDWLRCKLSTLFVALAIETDMWEQIDQHTQCAWSSGWFVGGQYISSASRDVTRSCSCVSSCMTHSSIDDRLTSIKITDMLASNTFEWSIFNRIQQEKSLVGD